MSRYNNRNTAASSSERDMRFIDESIKITLEQLDNVAKRTNANKENIGQDKIKVYCDRIIDLTAKMVGVKNELQKTMESISNEINSHEASSCSTVHSFDHNELKQKIKKRIAESLTDYDVTKDPMYLKIAKTVRKSADDMEEDLELVDTGLSAKDLKCPYSQMRLQEPMRNRGGPGQKSCIHHISRLSLVDLCRRSRTATCPVPACSGMWSLDTAEIDHEFQLKMERFERLQNISSSTMISTSAAHYVDAEYTQV